MKSYRLLLVSMVCLGLAWLASASAAGPGAEAAAGGGHQGLSHHEHAANMLFALGIILLVAKFGGHAFEVIRMPAVLGELLGGIVIGNLYLLGINWFSFLENDPVIQILAEIGIIFLLFEVGLESKVSDLLRVGVSSLLVALAGVVVPFALGYAVSVLFLPDLHFLVHVFVAATLCATSVGITARVLRDAGKIDTDEASIVLGAAVIDDVLGLVILAVVTGAITAHEAGVAMSYGGMAMILVKAVGFFIVMCGAGIYLSPHIFKFASRLQGQGMLLAVTVVFCFFMSYLAAKIGLAMIVGAFAAGLILDEVHYKDFAERKEGSLEDLLKPISYFLVPVFFVLMGMQVELKALARTDGLLFTLVLTVAAIIGKQVCSLCVVQKGVNRLAVGVGMVPRGEVGLIFAGIGAHTFLDGEPVISGAVYSAVVVMVAITTLVTPPVLKHLMTHTAAPDRES